MRLPPGQGLQLAQFGGRVRRLGDFLPLLKAFRFNVERPGGGLSRAALLRQAQRFGAEGRIVRVAFVGLCCLVRDEGKIPPCSVQVYPTASKPAGPGEPVFPRMLSGGQFVEDLQPDFYELLKSQRETQ